MKPNEIRNVLETTRTAAGPSLRSGEDFWAEFRSRVTACGADPVAATGGGGRRHPLRWVAWWTGPWVAAAALWMAVARFGGVGAAPSADAVRSYRVGADVVHGGIMILNDEPSHATILWVVDCAEQA